MHNTKQLICAAALGFSGLIGLFIHIDIVSCMLLNTFGDVSMYLQMLVPSLHDPHLACVYGSGTNVRHFGCA